MGKVYMTTIGILGYYVRTDSISNMIRCHTEESTGGSQSAFFLFLLFGQSSTVLNWLRYPQELWFDMQSIDKPMTSFIMMSPSDDQIDVRFGHWAPQCIIQKSWRNTFEKPLRTSYVWHPKLEVPKKSSVVSHIIMQIWYINHLIEKPI